MYFFCVEMEEKMPGNQLQRMVFAFLTVLITVHAYVFFSLYVVNGNTLMELNQTTSVIAAIDKQGGIYMFGTYLPIWACVLIEFCFAFALENVVGSPASFRLARRIFHPAKDHPMLFETAIICATVGIMCPAMSLIAAFLYYPYYMDFNIFTLLANWLKLMCFNFPFAFFTQLFFIQPAVRVIFKTLFQKELKNRMAEKTPAKPQNEQEAILEIFRQMDELQEEIAHEHRRRKALEQDVQKISLQ